MTSFQQFRAALGDEKLRHSLGIDIDQAEADWVVDDEAAVEARYREWLAERNVNSTTVVATRSPSTVVPGRVSGFVWGLLSVILTSVLFGIVAVVLATRAGKMVHAGESGRGLINAAFILGYTGMVISVILWMTAIGLWLRLH